MLAGRVDTSPEGGVAEIVEGFLHFVEEGLVVTEEAALEGSVWGVAEFDLHRARAQKAVVGGLVRPMGGVKKGIFAHAYLVPKVHGILEAAVVIGDGEVVVIDAGDLRGVEEPSAGLLVEVMSGAVREFWKWRVGTIRMIVHWLGPGRMIFIICFVGVRGGRRGSGWRSGRLLEGEEDVGGFFIVVLILEHDVGEDRVLGGRGRGGGDERGLIIILRLRLLHGEFALRHGCADHRSQIGRGLLPGSLFTIWKGG
jgi:hypothetical protein